MAHAFTILLFKYGCIEPSKATITVWRNDHDIHKIEFALKHGNYKTRQYAAEALEFVGLDSSIPLLLIALNDKIHNVSIAALNALDTLVQHNHIRLKVIKKRFYWFKKCAPSINHDNQPIKRKYNVYPWERSSKKSLEMVKERLKRPIR